MKTVLKVTGMSCEHCVRHVIEALEALDGVKKAKVSLKKGTAAVECEGSVTLEEMKAAVADAGYGAEEG